MQRPDRTIVISSHQLTDLERFADHVAILNRGRLMAAAPMDGLIERYRQLDVVVTGGAFPLAEGLRVLRSDGARMRLLVDRARFPADGLAKLGAETVAEVPLTLEELFLALVGPGAAGDTRSAIP
jgi:ABC-2 type transport system ATP-binding protein